MTFDEMTLGEDDLARVRAAALALRPGAPAAKSSDDADEPDLEPAEAL
jgi:hypothetical protein